ncbi:hypothetical protein [Roseiterribacter gracilis]|uniref:hypothetical protein n=1 Tax=Roseiterribacter gracilis TaxID=2812848 RepID=UPI003B42C7F3
MGSDRVAEHWLECGIDAGPAAFAEAASQVNRLQAWYGAARDPAVRRSFVRDHLPGGDILVSGAGLHTPGLLADLEARPDIRVRALVDRLAATRREVYGLPVVTPDEAAAEKFDYVLLSHTSFEPEMTRQLVAAGVAPARIKPIYSSDAYQGLVAARPPRPVPDRSFDAIVVTTHSNTIVGDAELAGPFPPDRTLVCYMGRVETATGIPGYAWLDLQESIDDLVDVIRRVRPRVVYVRLGLLSKNYIPMYLKARVPDVRVIVEFYDVSASWRDQDALDLFGLDDTSLRMMRLCELATFESTDLVISKRGGPEWDRIVGSLSSPYELFFPQVRMAGEQQQRPATELRRLAFAGVLLPLHVLASMTQVGFVFLDVLDQLGATGRYEIDLFNSLHVPLAQEEYASYEAKYATGAVRYHPRLSYPDLMSRLGGYDFGWMCEVDPPAQIDRRVSVCNRFTGYLSAGLPPILDDSWSFVSQLVREYRAGITVSKVNPQTVDAALQAHDPNELRAGLGRLRTHMLAANDKVIERIARVADEPARPWLAPAA